MLLGCIADDFTGASDLANTLAKGGMRTVQVIGVPEGEAVEAEACVVALKSRSIPAGEAVAQSLEALAWLRDQGCRQILFKICSTFDSTPEGNIGPVALALAEALGAAASIVCPAFPGAGRTVYQGHLFVFDRLLSESGMERHPLNPMTDADLRRWLRRQAGDAEIGHLPLQTVRDGAGAMRAALDGMAERGLRLVIADAIADSDLFALGEASAEAPLLIGGSGIGLGLPENFRRAGLLRPADSGFAGSGAPAAILAGSCSTATRGQIAAHARAGHPAHEIDVDSVVTGRIDGAALTEALVRDLGREPLLFSSADPAAVAALQARHGRERVAAALDDLFADVARRLVEAGVGRLVVAGGETSGAVVSGLGIRAFAIGPEIDPGVPALEAVRPGRGPLALALKSGNFGGPDFFAKAARVLGGADA